MTRPADTALDEARRDALVDRLFQATIASLELLTVHLGWRLGLYRALAESGPLTAAALAARAGIDPRYSREWLEQQATAGLLDVDDADVPADARCYRLPPEHAEVLVDADSESHVTPFAGLVAGIGQALPDVVDSYRTGAGVPYARYGPDLRDGQGAINRPAFLHHLAGWMTALPDIHQRLQTVGGKVADVACGQGYSSVALARTYPAAAVVGIDADAASIVDARATAAAAGVAVEFAAADAASLVSSGPYDLVCVFEALHDMARPVEVLAAARAALTADGAVLVVDERVADRFGAVGDPVERMMYGWSVLHCLPAARAEAPSAALGTVLRADTVRELAQAAGFATVEVLDIEHDFFRFYRLGD